jgi:formate hydrogenlyase transcriptional activator
VWNSDRRPAGSGAWPAPDVAGWCTVMDVAETEQAANSAVKSGAHPDFETLLSDLSSRLIVLPPAEIDGAIQDGLRRVCEFFDIDRALLWQWAAVTPAVLVPTHTYLSEEATQPPEPLRQEDCPWYVEQMLAGRTVVVAALGQLPAEASVDRETISRRGVKSNLTVPLSTGDAPPLGALGFTTTQAERDWPETVVKRLQLVAQFFANALARKRSDEALRESEERLALAADSAEAGLWALDDGTGVIWATERARVIFGFSADEVVTLDVLQSSIHPDDRRLVQEAIERSARSGESTSVECRVMTSEGDVNWILLRGRAHFATTGELGRVMGVAIDISERKRAQDALLALRSTSSITSTTRRTSMTRIATSAAFLPISIRESDP